MARKLSLLFRPFGLAFGIFITLNLALALQAPRLSVTGTWLPRCLPEPWLSLFAGLLGAALFLPDAAARASTTRCLLIGTFAGFLVLTLGTTVAFYWALFEGRILTDLPLPLSAVLAAVLLSEILRVVRWMPTDPLSPPPARVFMSAVLVTASFLTIILAHVITYGHADHRRSADAAVVFGAKVYGDGRPCAALVDRLETAIDLYRNGLVGHLIFTGARDSNGQSEPAVMRAYAMGKGIPAGRIILDEGGINTRASAVNAGRIQRKYGFERLLAVTQYFHCARVKLIFDREGTSCFTVPTCSSRRADADGFPVKLSREGFFLLREAIAFPFYLIYYR